jgi:hypothetical protein
VAYKWKLGDMFFGKAYKPFEASGVGKLLLQESGKSKDHHKGSIVYNDQYLNRKYVDEFDSETREQNRKFAENLRKQGAFKDKEEYRKIIACDKCSSELDYSLFSTEENNVFWRRKSKMGIHFQLVKRKKVINFALCMPLQYSMTDVAQKSEEFVMKTFENDVFKDYNGKQKAGPENKKRYVTHAELRYLYRNRKKFGVEKLVNWWYEVPSPPRAGTWSAEQGKDFFGELMDVVCDKKAKLLTVFIPGPAPWEVDVAVREGQETWKKAWAGYKPQSEDKDPG